MNGDLLNNKIIENGYCIGCGACAFQKNSCFTMEMTKEGVYKASKISVDDTTLDYWEVCPFTDSTNEDKLGQELFGQTEDIKHNEYEGFYLEHYIGFAKTNHRLQGSSGGLGTWILEKLINEKQVENVFHVKLREVSSAPLYSYAVSSSIDELNQGASSRYYPVEMSEILSEIKLNKKKCAIVGVPCFIKAINKLQKVDPELNELIKFKIGIVCGHQKSEYFSKAYALQLGIPYENIYSINFREKIPGRLASQFGVKVEYYDGEKLQTIIKPTAEFSTTNWGLGYFKNSACEFCDDVLNETADITLGDAWLRSYVNDYKGTNIVIVRNPYLKALFEEYSDEIQLQTCSAEDIYTSQAGGFRHRRDGLSYRLYLKEFNNEYVPSKRVKPTDKLNKKRKLIYTSREELRKQSFIAFEAAEKHNDFRIFDSMMAPYLKEYQRISRRSLLSKIISRISKIIRR